MLSQPPAVEAPGPLAVRAVAFFAAAAGLWVAAPTAFVSFRLLLPITMAAVLVALLPGSRAVGVTMTFTVLLWVLATLAFGEPATAGRTPSTAGA